MKSNYALSQIFAVMREETAFTTPIEPIRDRLLRVDIEEQAFIDAFLLEKGQPFAAASAVA